ncbi:MAG: FAD-binding protein, partial [Bacteroidaceae bacterium]
YMTFGVKTDDCLRALKNGVSVSNLYVAGSVLAGHDSVKQADATGVSLITGLAVSKSILKQK